MVSGCSCSPPFVPLFFSLGCMIFMFVYALNLSEVFWVQHELFRFQSKISGSWLCSGLQSQQVWPSATNEDGGGRVLVHTPASPAHMSILSPGKCVTGQKSSSHCVIIIYTCAAVFQITLDNNQKILFAEIFGGIQHK